MMTSLILILVVLLLGCNTITANFMNPRRIINVNPMKRSTYTPTSRRAFFRNNNMMQLFASSSDDDDDDDITKLIEDDYDTSVEEEETPEDQVYNSYDLEADHTKVEVEKDTTPTIVTREMLKSMSVYDRREIEMMNLPGAFPKVRRFGRKLLMGTFVGATLGGLFGGIGGFGRGFPGFLGRKETMLGGSFGKDMVLRWAKLCGKSYRWGKIWAPVGACWGATYNTLNAFQPDIRYSVLKVAIANVAGAQYNNRFQPPKKKLMVAAIYMGLTYFMFYEMIGVPYEIQQERLASKKATEEKAEKEAQQLKELEISNPEAYKELQKKQKKTDDDIF